MKSQKKNRIPGKLFLAAAAVALLFSCLVLTSLAAEPEWQTLTDGGTLQSGYYRLENDVTLTKNITIGSKAQVTIDLNGHVLVGGRREVKSYGNAVRLFIFHTYYGIAFF